MRGERVVIRTSRPSTRVSDWSSERTKAAWPVSTAYGSVPAAPSTTGSLLNIARRSSGSTAGSDGIWVSVGTNGSVACLDILRPFYAKRRQVSRGFSEGLQCPGHAGAARNRSSPPEPGAPHPGRPDLAGGGAPHGSAGAGEPGFAREAHGGA